MTRACATAALLAGLGCTRVDRVICAPGYGASDAGVCVPVAPPGGRGDGSAEPPDLPEPPPPLDLAEAEATLQAALDAGLPEPLLLAEQWTSAIDAGTGGGCPGSGDYSLIRGVRGCTSSEGYTFAGPADWTRDEDSFFLEADSYILRPDGTLLSYNGELGYEVDRSAGVTTWRGDVRGSFVDDAAAGWLGTGVSTDLVAKGSGAAEDAEVQLSGGCSVGLETVLFEDLVWTPACGASGTLATLDAAGRAYRLSVDCSSCGPLSLGDDLLGDACLDLSALEALVARLAAP